MSNDSQIEKIKSLQAEIIKASGNTASMIIFAQTRGVPVMLDLLAIALSQAQLIQEINRRLLNVESKE